jgi:predicted dehydrogenase
MTLRAVVIGAGWAGEGHTKALRHCGVDVIAICARQADVTQAVADRLGVPIASTDWRRTLETEKPDIVTVATPASLRGEVVEKAVELGIHLLVDKPLAVNAQEAKRLFSLAERAGVKHAYAATHRYGPSTAWAAELLNSGIIGPVREIDFFGRLNTANPLAPWGWYDQLASGGGILNNAMTHLLGMLERMIGGEVINVTGEAQVLRREAPVVPMLHDFRERRTKTPTAEEAANLEWRPCDVDGAFSAFLRFAAPKSGEQVRVCTILNFAAKVPAPTNGWYFYGTEGTMVGEGAFSFTLSQVGADGERKHLPIPQRLLDDLPQVGDDYQNKWTALLRDFVADIRGEPHSPYLTFRDGWRYQEVIDAIRDGRGWFQVPA